MEPTTGLILRRITQTDLSVSAHKLATLILDGIAWKEGYNGLPRGTAAFTLSALSEKMGVSRQYLTVLLSELEASDFSWSARNPTASMPPGCSASRPLMKRRNPTISCQARGDTSLSRDNSNKTIFSGQININATPNVFQTCWAELIKAAKSALPCWNVDTQVIWDRFLAFNRARGNEKVPAGFLLGFMRRWRTAPGMVPRSEPTPAPNGRLIQKSVNCSIRSRLRQAQTVSSTHQTCVA